MSFSLHNYISKKKSKKLKFKVSFQLFEYFLKHIEIVDANLQCTFNKCTFKWSVLKYIINWNVMHI